MRPFYKRYPLLVLLVSCQIALPWQLASAAKPVLERDVPVPTTQPALNDIALQRGNVLRGVIVNEDGTRCPQGNLTISYKGKRVTTFTSDNHGVFEITLPHGGIYHLVSSQGSTWLRVWQPKTAPPHAANRALLVQATNIHRGQWSPANALFSHPHIVLGVAALLVAVPVLMHNNRTDRDRSPSS